jgi:hypothetical protein
MIFEHARALWQLAAKRVPFLAIPENQFIK